MGGQQLKMWKDGLVDGLRIFASLNYLVWKFLDIEKRESAVNTPTNACLPVGLC